MQRIARPRRNGAGCHSKKNNGNIAETFWRTDSDGVLRTYGYVYDALNRMTDAHYAKHDSSLLDIDSYKEHVAYDRNGNIQALERNGEFDDDTYYLQTDDLTYTYDTDNPNQLLKVDDASGNPNGFKDGVNTGDDYGYDANGNMTSDLNKNITGIRYNHMNLPLKISFGTTDYIEYLYDAAGTKLRKTVSWIPEVIPAVITPEVKVTDYLDGYQYEDDALQFFPTAEGYVKNTPDTEGNHFNYVYNYTDHLGNIRLSYGYDDEENVLKILEENNYYPFGLKHANYNMSKLDYDKVVPSGGIGIVPRGSLVYQYKFQGQERQDELGLGWDSFKYRNYDYAIGRFMSIDPLAEDYNYQSPYNFAENKVVSHVEIEGLEGLLHTYTDKAGNKSHVIEKNVIILTQKKIDNPNGSESINRKNKNIEQSNADRVNNIKKDLDAFYGPETKNSKNEKVSFKLNITEMEVDDTKGRSLVNGAYVTQISHTNGLESGETDLEGEIRMVPAAIYTTRTPPEDGYTTGNIVDDVLPTAPFGTQSHELAHTLGLRDNKYGRGGILHSPPQPLTPEEVDEIIDKSYESK